jgi:hypothetical protein
VKVRDGLARGLAGVEADVVAVGGQLGVEGALDLVDQRQHRGALGLGGAEPVGDDAAGDDQGVAGRDREAVANGERQLVAGDPARGGYLEED